MDLITLTCPSCGAPVTLGENVLAVVCAYCRSQIQRRTDSADRLAASRADGLRALRLGDYDEADLHFSEALGQDAGDRPSRLYRAVALALRPNPDLRQALTFFKASAYTTEAAAEALSELAGQNPQFLHDLLAHHAELITGAPALSDVIYAAVLRTRPLDAARSARLYAAAADQAWQLGSIERATELMVKALSLDAAARPVNLWLFDLAQKKLVSG